ncbi:MAG: pyrroline-5-carboxylate reductase [Candidatus Omnitrophota bacterium]
MMTDKKIGIIGCGNMGEAIFSRLSQAMEKSTSLMVSEMDYARRSAIQDKYRIIVAIDNNYLVKYCDVIILAVKPKYIESVLGREVCCGMSPDKLLISIAAGITTKHIESVVGKDIPVIRVMPNMPAVIGEAISSISAGASAAKEHMALAREIFSMIGTVVEVEEGLVDAVTAISGSGPAYFFYFIESLIEAAGKLKLDGATARELVIKTALGSAKLLDRSKEDPALLRRKVTSKGGTTEAALKVFDAKKLKNIVCSAAEAACKRSGEMSKG